jgi:hypothetical protein
LVYGVKLSSCSAAVQWISIMITHDDKGRAYRTAHTAHKTGAAAAAARGLRCIMNAAPTLAIYGSTAVAAACRRLQLCINTRPIPRSNMPRL